MLAVIQQPGLSAGEGGEPAGDRRQCYKAAVLEFRILGPLEVRSGGQALDPGAPVQVFDAPNTRRSDAENSVSVIWKLL